MESIFELTCVDRGTLQMFTESWSAAAKKRSGTGRCSCPRAERSGEETSGQPSQLKYFEFQLLLNLNNTVYNKMCSHKKIDCKFYINCKGMFCPVESKG